MKVEVENCTSCGAKNSRYVDNCYQCKAFLPWSPKYAGSASKQTARTSSQATSPSSNSASRHTQPYNSRSANASNEGTARVPVWAIVCGVAGSLVLGGIIAFSIWGGNPNSVENGTAVALTPNTSGNPSPSMGVSNPSNPPVAVAPPAVQNPVAQNVIPIPPSRPGPTFDEVDSKMDDRGYHLTEAQKQSYWQSVAGTQVTWTGQLTEADLKQGGSLRMRCGPQTQTSDTVVNLDGSQVSMLGSISKGQRLTVQGIMEEHSIFGYTLTNGRIVSFN